MRKKIEGKHKVKTKGKKKQNKEVWLTEEEN